MGSGRKTDGLLEISEYKNGAAIVSTGTVALNADQLDMLEIQVYNDSNRVPRFFWRTSSLPDLQMTPLYNEQRHLLLDNLPDWSGRITEAGVAFFGDETTRAGVEKLVFSPKTLKTSLQSVLDDWAALGPWTTKSINYGRTGPRHTAGSSCHTCRPMAATVPVAGLSILAGSEADAICPGHPAVARLGTAGCDMAQQPYRATGKYFPTGW